MLVLWSSLSLSLPSQSESRAWNSDVLLAFILISVAFSNQMPCPVGAHCVCLSYNYLLFFIIHFNAVAIATDG